MGVDDHTRTRHRACRDVFSKLARARKYTAMMAGPPLNINIETVRKCNGSCHFCPASTLYAQPESAGHLMPDAVYERLCRELHRIKYVGRISFFVTNEPLLDPKIVDRVSAARTACEHATLRLMTNGLLLTGPKVEALFRAGLDMLDISLYTPNPKVENKIQSLAAHPLSARIRVFSRRRDAQLFNRAGHSVRGGVGPMPPVPAGCLYPFTQLNISSYGTVGQCCHDFQFNGLWGDVCRMSFDEIWNGAPALLLRRSLLANRRRQNRICSACDYPGTPRDQLPPAIAPDVARTFLDLFPRDR